jgi:tetratricopeptide (TPR) repeat protein
VRVAVANNLLAVGLQDSQAFCLALEELLNSDQVSQLRGEGKLNKSIVQIQLERSKQAIQTLLHAIKFVPYFEANYMNLRDIYRAEKKTLKKSLKHSHLDSKPILTMRHCMYLIRQQQTRDAVAAIKQAIKYALDNVQFLYVYLLALDGSGQTKCAMRDLKMPIRQNDNHPQLVELGLSFVQKLGDSQARQFFETQVRPAV